MSFFPKGRMYFCPSLWRKTPERLKCSLEIWTLLAKRFWKDFDTLKFKIKTICCLTRVQFSFYLFIYLLIDLFIYLLIHLFIYLAIYLKLTNFTKVQYMYIHKNSQTNWLIKVNYPILQKKSNSLLIKKKKKRKEKKNKTGWQRIMK